VQKFWDQKVALMDYGYCLTAHKAQGSEWEEVLVLEEIARGWDACRWRYTTTTRAKERLTYCA
jgi:ATP-dependent exoDNAse (exonuclease V) alpha subunit